MGMLLIACHMLISLLRLEEVSTSFPFALGITRPETRFSNKMVVSFNLVLSALPVKEICICQHWT